MGDGADSAELQETSPERLFRTVSGELERTLWHVLMRPTDDALRVLQLGSVVELMPNVYLQAVRLMYHKPFDRYVRLWYVGPAANGAEGETEERTLLCFYTPGFPDPQFTEVRPGMDLNLTWLDSIRERLGALLDRVDEQYLAEAAEARSAISPPPANGNGNGTGFGRAPASDLTLATRPAVNATPLPLTAATSGTKRAEMVTLHAEQVFEDLKRGREEAYAERDRVEAALKDAYFVRYPFMRQAMQHSSDLKVADLIGGWVRQGCPDPDPAQTAHVSVADPGATYATTAAPTASTAALTPWALAMQLERAQALIAERAKLLEQICELTGGHYPMPQRDVQTGRMLTLCSRCGAQLSAREPDASDDWMR